MPCSISWGGGSLLPVDTSIVHSVALAKTTAPAMVLFFKGALCNWLVCLAIWMALRTEGAAKFNRYLVVSAGIYRVWLRALYR
ncbi:nitrite transporter [Escherichia coli]|uniref:Nitrite transporter n=1 Tax=Escherichia coli TaxID=562 RepID=A0A2X3LMA9_ECOLX|nr:nitrite transporter [Escherichia coli]